MLPLDAIATPAYVADVAALKANATIAARIKQATGCQMLLALKAWSQFSLFDVFRDTLDGTTASGLFEAQLGHRHFGKAVHAYSPAFTADEIAALVPICSHVYFNSVDQMRRFAPAFRAAHGDKAVIGLRVNPGLSLVKNSDLYDPSRPGSRFGVQPHELTDEVLAEINLLHIHNLCENLSNDSVTLIEHVMEHFAPALACVKYINFGGGHYITHPDYDVDALCDAIKNIQTTFNLTVILEPGGALVYQGGYLVSTVLDVIHNDDIIAILDTSATCHMPDVLEVPYRPTVWGDDDAHPHRVVLTGKTCLTGDVIGTYHFAKPLKAGDKIVFADMMQYAMVKNTTFNGLPLPDIGAVENGEYRLIKRFGYEDFEGRLS